METLIEDCPTELTIWSAFPARKNFHGKLDAGVENHRSLGSLNDYSSELATQNKSNRERRTTSSMGWETYGRPVFP
jgi:hypothetical protein